MRFALALAGCFLASGGSMAQSAVDRAKAAVTACYREGAAELDDKKSDARTIAMGVYSRCQSNRDFLTSLLIGKPEAGTDVYRVSRDTREQVLDNIVVFVLKQRRAAP